MPIRHTAASPDYSILKIRIAKIRIRSAKGKGMYPCYRYAYGLFWTDLDNNRHC